MSVAAAGSRTSYPTRCRCSSCRAVRLRGLVRAVTLRLAWLALGIPFGMGVEFWIWTR